MGLHRDMTATVAQSVGERIHFAVRFLKCPLANRFHHLLKTFYTGAEGSQDRQLPDGTIIWTAPTGHTYISEAHGAAMFPTLAQPTGELPEPTLPEEPNPYRTVMMPRRKQTRAQDRHDRITAERRQRTELITQQRQHQAWLAQNYEPPPF